MAFLWSPEDKHMKLVLIHFNSKSDTFDGWLLVTAAG